jgi:hypothetical protein
VRPSFELLEDRTVPTVNMSPFEQLMLELINRARANPAAEAARFGIGLNEGVAPEDTISTAAKQPLAPNQNLLNAIRDHLEWLAPQNLNGIDPHTGQGGSTLGGRANAAGYTGWSNLGENLSWSGGTSGNQASSVIAHHQLLFVDANIVGRGHRVNMLNPTYKEIGSGVHNQNRFMTGQDFGRRNGDSFLTGIVYSDALVDDDFYTVINASTHEGIAGATIVATNNSTSQQFTTTSGTSGNFALRLPNGTYTVTATGPGNFDSFDVTINGSNVKVDLQPSPIPTATSSPADLITTANSNPYSFTVTYSDNVAVDVSTLDGAVRVTGPNGFSQVATLTGVSPSGDGSLRTATYQIAPSGGAWDAGDTGTYTVEILADTAADTAGNFVPAGPLGSFDVTVDASAPSAAITGGGATSAPVIHLTVTFSEVVTGFDASDLDFSGGSIQPTIVQVASADGITYGVTISGMPGSGSISAIVTAGAAFDLAGNPSTASPGSTPFTYTLRPDRIGIYRAGTWTLDANGNGNSDDDSPFANLDGVLIGSGVRGDWNGDGRDDWGRFYRGTWVLDFDGDGDYVPGSGDLTFKYGKKGDKPVVGDWDGDGDDDVGFFRPLDRKFKLDRNGNRVSNDDSMVKFGGTGIPVVGNWDPTSRKDEVGLFKDGVWKLDTSGDGRFTAGIDAPALRFGSRGDKPVVGDWDGNATSDLGLYRAGVWSLDTDQNFSTVDLAFTYGTLSDKPNTGQ